MTWRPRPRRKTLIVVLMIGAMVAFGVAVNLTMGHFKTVDGAGAGPGGPVARPADVRPQITLPGVLYVAQAGDIYRLSGSTFSPILTADSTHSWSQPAEATPGHLVVVARGTESSDLYLTGADGSAPKRLTSDAAPTASDATLTANHWAMYPHLGSDGATILLSYDFPKCGYANQFAAWSIPLAPAPSAPPTPSRAIDPCNVSIPAALPSGAHQLSTPNQYTGGDVQPLPLANGSLLVTRYAFDDQSRVHATLTAVRNVRDAGTALTVAADDCSQPDISRDGMHIAMICTGGRQSARLVVATLSPQGKLSGSTTLVDQCLCAAPAWSPDGASLVYLAPNGQAGQFQLMYVRSALAGAAQTPVQVTDRLGLDATSKPLWIDG